MTQASRGQHNPPNRLRLSHVTLRDSTLPHQVVFITRGAGYPGVSCNCRGEVHENGTITHDDMGAAPSTDRARELYNDPANHWTPFTEEDKAKW